MTMKKPKFTKEQLLTQVKKVYNGPICTDFLEDAMKEPDIESAAQILVLDSAYWNNELVPSQRKS